MMFCCVIDKNVTPTQHLGMLRIEYSGMTLLRLALHMHSSHELELLLLLLLSLLLLLLLLLIIHNIITLTHKQLWTQAASALTV